MLSALSVAQNMYKYYVQFENHNQFSFVCYPVHNTIGLFSFYFQLKFTVVIFTYIFSRKKFFCLLSAFEFINQKKIEYIFFSFCSHCEKCLMCNFFILFNLISILKIYISGRLSVW